MIWATLRQSLALLVYGGLMRLLWPVAALRWRWRARREPGYAQDLAARFGLYRQAAEAGALWIHAVSLGETRAAEPLIAALRAAHPDVRLLLSHGTATGRETGRALLRNGDQQTWLPLDSPGAVRRFLAHFRPALGVMMETEIWPGLMAAAQAAEVPIWLVNARLSARSLRKAQRFDALMRPAAQRLSGVLAQTADDAERLASAGAPRGQVFGNLKFDLRPDPAVLARGEAWRLASGRPVVLAAVWREGEDVPLLDTWGQVLREAAATGREAPLLLIVPRHPQRFDEVAGLAQARGWRVVRRSAWLARGPEAGPAADDAAADVCIGDSLREMPAYYALADVALLGGSYAPLGGQNLIEAAACSCPVVMGPHTFNFAEAAALAEMGGAAQRVADLPAAVAVALDMLKTSAAEASARRERCARFAQAHQGAAARSAAVLWAAYERAAPRARAAGLP